MESLSSIKTNIDTTDGLIETNYTNANAFLAILKESVASTVQTQLGDMNSAPVETDTIELDEAWWEEHAAELGWVKDGGFYVYTDPETGEKYEYSPKGHQMKYVDAKGSTLTCGCTLYLNGDLSDVTETITLLKNSKAGKDNVSGKSTRAQLLIVPEVTGDEKGDNAEKTRKAKILASNRTLACSMLCDKLLGSAGNTNDVKQNLCGFSMGGQHAMNMVSGEFGDKFVGYYDKVTLVNISPGDGFRYTDRQVQNMAGMEFDIVNDYNNIVGGRDGLLDYISTQKKGPHLDKLASIPGAKVTLYLPDASKDTVGSVAKTAAYVEGCGLDNVTLVQFEVSDSELADYGIGVSGAVGHENGRLVLMPRYLSGDLAPIE